MDTYDRPERPPAQTNPHSTNLRDTRIEAKISPNEGGIEANSVERGPGDPSTVYKMKPTEIRTETKPTTKSSWDRPENPTLSSPVQRTFHGPVASTVEPESEPSSNGPRSRGVEPRVDAEIGTATKNVKEIEEVIQLRLKIEYMQKDMDELSAQNIKLRTNMKDLLDRYDKLEADNSSLRARIVSSSKPPGQTNDDGFYIQKLNWLNEFTQQWVASSFKGLRGHYLDRDKEIEIESILNGYEAGQALLQQMKRSRVTLQTIYRVPDRRIALVRQLIALYLTWYVFRPFCAGIPEDMNEILWNTMAYILDNEREFSKVLIIRQALGQGVLHQFKPLQARTKASLVTGFENTLKYLLPTPQDIRPKIEKLLDGAFELANAITVEQAFFKSKLFIAGQEFSRKYMYVPDDKQAGLIMMCTFPRFTKLVMSDGNLVSRKIVDASVELESVFREPGSWGA